MSTFKYFEFQEIQFIEPELIFKHIKYHGYAVSNFKKYPEFQEFTFMK